MENIMIGLTIANLVVLIIVLFILLLKKKDESTVSDKLSKLEVGIVKEIGDFKSDFSGKINEDFNNMNDKIDKRLRLISDKVNERLDENFEKTNKTFINVLERLSKIDEAQKKIDILSSDIVSLQSVLTDKKTRGTFGEVNLKHILVNVFGEGSDSIYQLQYTFPDGTRVDSVLFAPEPLGTIAIDSKFPLENYQTMVDKKKSMEERKLAEKQFKVDIRRHIDDIANKYIIKGVTSDQAMMFLPAEAIFAELNAYHLDLIEYAYKKRVWIVSPTTLMSTLTVIQMVLKNMERDKYTSIIHEELKRLGVEFNRYEARWDKLSRSIETVHKDAENIHKTTEKISKRLNQINQVEMELEETKQIKG